MLTRRIAWVGLGVVLGCGDPAEETAPNEFETDTAADTDADDGPSCADRFAEAQCLGGGLPRFEVGDVGVPSGITEPQVVAEFEGGRLVEGMPGDVQVIYADDTCLVTCVWMLPQTTFCEGVDDEGGKTCVFGGNVDVTVDECMEFAAGCPG